MSIINAIPALARVERPEQARTKSNHARCADKRDADAVAQRLCQEPAKIFLEKRMNWCKQGMLFENGGKVSAIVAVKCQGTR